MIFATVDDGDPRVSTHEAVKDVFANRWYSGESQSFVDNRRNDRYGLSSADQRIAKPVAVHFHKVGAIYNKCTDGSMLNVLQMGPVLNYGVVASLFQRRVASKCSFLF